MVGWYLSIKVGKYIWQRNGHSIVGIVALVTPTHSVLTYRASAAMRSPSSWSIFVTCSVYRYARSGTFVTCEFELHFAIMLQCSIRLVYFTNESFRWSTSRHFTNTHSFMASPTTSILHVYFILHRLLRLSFHSLPSLINERIPTSHFTVHPLPFDTWLLKNNPYCVSNKSHVNLLHVNAEK